MQAGDLLLIYCSYIHSPGYKYVVCFCPQYSRFFFINSEPRISKPDAQVLVKKEEYSFLQYDSYINTGTVVTFSDHELSKAKHLGTLTDSIKKQIVNVVSKHKYLTENQTQIILQNFS